VVASRTDGLWVNAQRDNYPASFLGGPWEFLAKPRIFRESSVIKTTTDGERDLGPLMERNMSVATSIDISLLDRPGGVEEVRWLSAEERRLRKYALQGELPDLASVPAIAWIDRTIGQARYETRILADGPSATLGQTESRGRRERAALRIGVLNREIESVIARLAEFPACSELVSALRGFDLESSRQAAMSLRLAVRHVEVRASLNSVWANLSVFEKISLMDTTGHPDA
jgi:hypothetical protein